MSLEAALAEAKQIEGVTWSGGGLVPFPPTAKTPGSYLFLNCMIHSPESGVAPEALLERWRKIAEGLLQIAAKHLSDEQFTEILPTIYDGDNIRLYRTAIARDDLFKNHSGALLDARRGEESHHPTVRPLVLQKSKEKQ